MWGYWDVLDLLTSWFTPSHTRPNLSHLTIHQFGHRERPENGREKGTGIIVSLAETAGVREFLIFLCVLCELCERFSRKIGDGHIYPSAQKPCASNKHNVISII